MPSNYPTPEQLQEELALLQRMAKAGYAGIPTGGAMEPQLPVQAPLQTMGQAPGLNPAEQQEQTLRQLGIGPNAGYKSMKAPSIIPLSTVLSNGDNDYHISAAPLAQGNKFRALNAEVSGPLAGGELALQGGAGRMFGKFKSPTEYEVGLKYTKGFADGGFVDGKSLEEPIGQNTEQQINSMLSNGGLASTARPDLASFAKGGDVDVNDFQPPLQQQQPSAMEILKAEFAKRGLDFNKFISSPPVMQQTLANAQNMGINGDTMIAHINPKEAKLLKEHGGSGGINPNTGLPMFDDSGDSGSGGGGGTSDSGNGGDSTGGSPGGDASGGFGGGVGGTSESGGNTGGSPAGDASGGFGGGVGGGNTGGSPAGDASGGFGGGVGGGNTGGSPAGDASGGFGGGIGGGVGGSGLGSAMGDTSSGGFGFGGPQGGVSAADVSGGMAAAAAQSANEQAAAAAAAAAANAANSIGAQTGFGGGIMGGSFGSPGNVGVSMGSEEQGPSAPEGQAAPTASQVEAAMAALAEGLSAQAAASAPSSMAAGMAAQRGGSEESATSTASNASAPSASTAAAASAPSAATAPATAEESGLAAAIANAISNAVNNAMANPAATAVNAALGLASPVAGLANMASGIAGYGTLGGALTGALGIGPNSSVAVAENESQAQALENAMGMTGQQSTSASNTGYGSEGGGAGGSSESGATLAGVQTGTTPTTTSSVLASLASPTTSNNQFRQFAGYAPNPLNYGYGPAFNYYTYKSAKGGKVSPLKAMRKA